MLLIFIAFTVLLTFSAGLALYFRLRRPAGKSNSDTGILLQYKTLIDLALTEHPGSRLSQTKTNTFLIHKKDHQVSDSLSVTKVQGRIIVVWTWISPEFGKRGKEWSFEHDNNQVQMYSKIKQSRDAYLTSLYQQRNLAVPEKAGNPH
jgi:hypothetical protein